ncbi:hypothetical protein BpHYR1_042301 [Brachionus plicatilis]|uniref:Uncharacterized protein n=1 Tax=Brachionus plicatilis TaxID=10195 RepID=A0A3M7RTF2_BRAPC|nr:hypothetical protein BpHYR1_042301 [Brachionus plicatilis]
MFITSHQKSCLKFNILFKYSMKQFKKNGKDTRELNTQGQTTKLNHFLYLIFNRCLLDLFLNWNLFFKLKILPKIYPLFNLNNSFFSSSRIFIYNSRFNINNKDNLTLITYLASVVVELAVDSNLESFSYSSNSNKPSSSSSRSSDELRLKI